MTMTMTDAPPVKPTAGYRSLVSEAMRDVMTREHPSAIAFLAGLASGVAHTSLNALDEIWERHAPGTPVKCYDLDLRCSQHVTYTSVRHSEISECSRCAFRVKRYCRVCDHEVYPCPDARIIMEAFPPEGSAS